MKKSHKFRFLTLEESKKILKKKYTKKKTIRDCEWCVEHTRRLRMYQTDTLVSSDDARLEITARVGEKTLMWRRVKVTRSF